MSLNTDLTAMAQAMANFAPVYKTKLAAKVATTALADAALELDTMTPAQVATALDADLVSHENSTGANHLTGVAELTYSSAEIDTSLNGRVTLNSLPVSRYGDLTYLPPGVNGNFEGASMNFNAYLGRDYPLIIENDGTLVFLRNGSTGSKVGVYYAYVKNALQATTLDVPTRTNQRYQPSFFSAASAGATAAYVLKSDSQVIAGKLQDASGNPGDYFIALTNGTFDGSLHQTGVFITVANWPAFATNCDTEVFLANGTVYIMGLLPQTGSEIRYGLYSIPLASFGAGNYVTPTKVTGITSKSFSSPTSGSQTTTVADYIQVAPATFSGTGTDNALVYFATGMPAGVSGYMANGSLITDSGWDSTISAIRVRLTADIYIQDSNHSTSKRPFIAFSGTFDPATKTFQFDSEYTSPVVVTQNVNGAFAVFGPPVATGDKISVMPSAMKNSFDSTYFHPNGYWFAINDQNLPDITCVVSRAQIPAGNYTNRGVALHPNYTLSGNISTAFDPAFGSAIGGSMMGNLNLPGNRFLVYAKGRNAAGNTDTGLVLCDRGASGYTYKSVFSGSFSGYAPTAGRHFVQDLGFDRNAFNAMLSQIDTAGNVTTFGSLFIEGSTMSNFLTCDTNLATSGSVSVTQAVLDSVRSQLFTSIGHSGTPQSSNVTLFVPQNSSLLVYAILVWIDSTTEKMVMGEFSIASGSRAGALTGLTLVTNSAVQTGSTTATGVVNSTLNEQAAGGLTIYETSDAYLVGGASKILVGRYSNSGGWVFRFAIPKTTFKADWAHFYAEPDSISWESNFFGAIPGQGFGVFRQLQAYSDNYTKLVFWPVATNLATYNSWTVPAQTSALVEVSQDVAQGWSVYFTSPTPVLLNGTVYTMAPVTIDLTTVVGNPANQTFNVYLKLVGGVPTYVIVPSATVYPEAPDTMFLGQVITGASTITSMTISKVSRLDKFRPSTTGIGGAIAVSTGTPVQTGKHLAWT